MIKKLTLSFLALTLVFQVCGQELLSPSFTYSHKKTSYVTLKDGSEITGTLKDLDRKKGLIKQVKIEKEDGDKVKLKPEDIKSMYLPQSGLDKVSQAMDAATDAQKWNNEQMNQDLLDDGYVYFENADVYYKKKKKMELLMQLLNPHFSKEIKVYHDPMAKQSMGVGIGGVTLAGGLEKSYFIMTEGDEAAYKLKKKDYDDEYEVMWKGCDDLLNSEERAWRDLGKHVVEFSECQ
ncbi:hypothetical protein SAMN05661096_00201 [Marivirga sericea]|uniref:DUF4412 domain-containing protein n=1 Tax=Marivirga sericea TaxID=1028 RepID=A0A1X7I5I8_9BACT|nr:hypothetical protein [Marivirga sericea]SMG09344.1 hypothetical protein SAMN05661096_00201 [Marivirga sericea]